MPIRGPRLRRFHKLSANVPDGHFRGKLARMEEGEDLFRFAQGLRNHGHDKHERQNASETVTLGQAKKLVHTMAPT